MWFLLSATQTEWRRTVDLQDPRPVVVSRLRHHLGYGGLVHNFLNSILRPNSDHAHSATYELGAVRAALVEFEMLEISPLERSALDTVQRELNRIYEYVMQIDRGDYKDLTPEETYAALDLNLDVLARAVTTLAKVSFQGAGGVVSHMEILSRFEAAIGLDGMIQHLKLYVLTRNPEHLATAQASVATALELLEELDRRAESPAEIQAISIIQGTMRSYEKALATAQQMVSEGRTTMEIDYAIQINDQPALSAYATLMSFEKIRMSQSLKAINGNLDLLKWIVAATGMIFLLPWLNFSVRFNAQLRDAVPEWQSDLVGIATSLAKEDFENAQDYSRLPDELAALEEPFQSIRATLWHRRERAIQDESRREVLISDGEKARLQLASAKSEIKTLSAQTSEVKTELEQVTKRQDMVSQVMDGLSQGVMACCGLEEVVFWNNQMARLIGVEPEWLREGRSLEEVFLYLATRGEFGPGKPTELARSLVSKLEAELAKGSFRYDQRFTNTRVLAFEVSRDSGGMVLFSATDVTERHDHAEAMQQQATSDPLTGLANRTALDTFTETMLKHAERSGEVAAVMAVDLDGFKPVNDTHGHHAGDELLRQIAERLQEEVRETDLVARVGGDEFVIILLHLEDGNGALRFGQRLLRAIEMPITLESGTEVRVSASVGIALFPYHAREAQPLNVLADMALYEAKAQGRNAVVMYELPETRAIDVTRAQSSA